jgi:predicted nucleic acid-binding protein
MYLLDTNVISELRRPTKANPKVAAWSEQVNQAQLFTSVITILEIEMGILQCEYGDALLGAHLRTWMESYIRPAFSDADLGGNAKYNPAFSAGFVMYRRTSTQTTAAGKTMQGSPSARRSRPEEVHAS